MINLALSNNVFKNYLQYDYTFHITNDFGFKYIVM